MSRPDPHSSSDSRNPDRVFAIVGAGGLGGPIAYALAAAGARGLIICDDDQVDLSNLQRQVQFTTTDIGKDKVTALRDELLRRGYPGDQVSALKQRFTPANAASIIGEADVVIDGSDNFATKFAVNDACVADDKLCVIGGVLRYGGQVARVIPGRGGCYRCLFEEPPADDDAQSCATAGVLGASVAVIAGYAAQTAITIQREQESGLVVVDDTRILGEPRRISYHSRPDCMVCAAKEAA